MRGSPWRGENGYYAMKSMLACARIIAGVVEAAFRPIIRRLGIRRGGQRARPARSMWLDPVEWATGLS
jgi:hypothetical protein